MIVYVYNSRDESIAEIMINGTEKMAIAAPLLAAVS